KTVQHPEARTPQQADPALFGELSSFVAGNLSGFSVGEYYVLALFWDDRSDKSITSQLFGLSVYEADIKSLASITEQYRTGIGIFIIPMSQQGFQATLRSLQDEQVVAKLRKDFESM